MAPIHPGIFICNEYVNRLRLNRTELARRLDMSRVNLYSIMKGERGIGADVALRFEGVLGIPAERLLADQAEYELWEARQNLKDNWTGRLMVQSPQMSLAMG